MIDVEVAIIPIGTGSTSISEYIAESEKILQKHPKLNYVITSMATEIEGNDVNEIFDTLKEMHLAQINKGANRVETSIRIDDRRDKESTLSDKIESIQAKIR